MKSVFLLRHGEAQEENYDSDYNRKLTERGKLRSAIMADSLLESNDKCGLIISSGAARAKCTAEIFHNVFKLGNELLNFDDVIYTAHDPWLLMDIIWNCENSISSLMIVGHNPLLSELAATLTGKFRISMDKGAVVKIIFDVNMWEEIESTRGKIEYYKYFSNGEIVRLEI